MNGNDWTNYFYDLHQHIRQQDNKIKQLELRLREMEEKDQERPNTTIEKIEYNFDQLKIERLDGTLHIGLSPSDLENIDDFGVNKVQPEGSNSPAMEQTLQSDLRQHIRQEGPTIIQHLAEQYQKPIDDHFQSVMLQDIEKQLPQRIKTYAQEARKNNDFTSEDQIQSYVTDRIKQEIHQSLITYMQGNNQKGEES